MRIFFIPVFLFTFLNPVFSQVEYTNANDEIYNFLKRMQVSGNLKNYNSSELPYSREEIANFIKEIRHNERGLNSTDKKILADYEIEYEFDLNASLKNQFSLFQNFNLKEQFSDSKQKYFYIYADSNVNLFVDGKGFFSYRGSDGDSLGKNSILLSEIGLRARGTMYNSLGFFLRASNGTILRGENKDIDFASMTDPILAGNTKFNNERKNFDTFEGYLRYRTKENWLALTFGRTPVKMGFGYIDKMLLSGNTTPFDFGKLDLKYKNIGYTFLYGNIVGDSVGRDLSSKYIVTHRFDFGFTENFKMGFWEALIYSEKPISFTYLNPLSFITSADLNTGAQSTDQNNSLMGIDLEIQPVKNISFQSTLLIDDLNFSNLFKNDSSFINDNKFGWQFGAYWSNSFSIPSLDLILEYTHLDPFVYSHRTNKNSYTNWQLSLGHALPPNSDEIAAMLSYNITNRIKLDFLYQRQRSGEGIELDSAGNIVANYGGDINFGEGDHFLRQSKFLDGIRINRNIFTFNLDWQPVRQYFLSVRYVYRMLDNLSSNKKFNDSYWFLTFNYGR
jgi:hypothetical protein